MKIFEIKTSYNSGDMREQSPIREELAIILCIKGLRRFFDLPAETKLELNGQEYFIEVHDRKVKNALKVRLNPKRHYYIQSEYNEKWVVNTFYPAAEDRMLKLFEDTGKKYLYVRITEA